ncbi:hypothetical protein RUM44_012280 [Polyplax serrata]|uniref:CRAL-TRIO domain-containing protein n=1 Tax=Polyplax serrata TaxID=468196 RepID=A0ABR1BEW9_POLSC
MSMLKKLNPHDDLLKNSEKILCKIGERRLSITQVFSETELELWKKSQSKELITLREWLKKQPHLPQGVSDQQLLALLHSCSNSIEQTKGKIDSYYTIRTHAPEIFFNRSVTSKQMVLARKITRISPLRFATPEGYNAIFIDSVDPDVANYSFVEAMKIASLAIDVLVHCFPQEKGNVLVFDMKNSAVAHVIKTNLTTLKKAMVYVQKALPFVLKQIHVINAFPLIQQIQLLIKPFVDDNLSKMIHIHMQDNMESFYEFIPRKSLPKDYGGEADSLQDLNEKLYQLMLNYDPFLKSMDALVVDENKRTNASPISGDLFGIQGSFRKLDLD